MLIRDRVYERFATLASLMLDITNGLNFMRTSRKRECVACRMLITVVLAGEGFSEFEIGAMMNLSHSSIHHYKKRFGYINSPGFEAERDLWKKFKSKIDELA